MKCQYCGKEIDAADQKHHDIFEHDWCMTKKQIRVLQKIAHVLRKFYCETRICQSCPYFAESECPAQMLEADLTPHIVEPKQ